MPLENQALFVGYLVHLFALVLGLLLLVWFAVLILLWAIDHSTFRARMLMRICEYMRHREEFARWKAEKDSVTTMVEKEAERGTDPSDFEGDNY